MKEIFLTSCLKDDIKQAKSFKKNVAFDVNTLFENDNTVLHFVLQKTYKTVSPKTQKIINLLISAGADVSLTNSEGNNAMHIAASNDITYLIEVFLKRIDKLFIEYRKCQNNKKLMLTHLKKEITFITHILNKENNNQDTPLISIKNENIKLFKLLSEYTFVNANNHPIY